MAAQTYHSFHPGTLSLSCDLCGAMVPATERDKVLHGDWHEKQAAQIAEVVDLRVVEALAS